MIVYIGVGCAQVPSVQGIQPPLGGWIPRVQGFKAGLKTLA